MTTMAAAPNRPCLICGSTDLLPVLAIPGVPVLCNRLLPDRDQALAVARGNIDLVACRSCGHLFNRAFDPALVGYEGSYDNALHFSGRYQRYATATVRRLTRRYDLRGKQVVEIGCGRGDFLRLLCEHSGSWGIGYDPSASAQPSNGAVSDKISIIRDVYRAGATQDAHFVCCRHVLEHLVDPVAVLRAVGEDLRLTEGAAFLEVPDASLVLDQLSIWDIIYEHISYFSRSSLAMACMRAGLSVRDLQSAFGGQFLWAEAVAGAGAGAGTRATSRRPSPSHHALVASFAERVGHLLDHWRNRIAGYRRDGVRLALWGAGSKGVMFLNLLQLAESDDLPCVVDINPRKAGCHIAGTGQRIVGPADLRRYQPDVVLVMNPEYRSEIARSLLELDVHAGIDLVLARRHRDGNGAGATDMPAARIA